MTAEKNSETKPCRRHGRGMLPAFRWLFASLCGFVCLLPGRAEGQGILTLTPGRTAATVAGTGTAGYSGDGSAATAATLLNPSGAAYDTGGNLYVSDARNNVVRRIAVGGTITTVAGSGAQGYTGDGGAATAASLDQPMGLALDTSGNLYIADSHNHAIRKVTGTTISTVAGTGTAGFSGDSGTATSATLYLPQGVAVDAIGNVYIADTGNQRIRKVTGTTIATLAGTGNEAYLGDGGSATAASLDMPAGLALDASGNLYIADSHNQTVRKITGTTITTVAGSGTAGFAGDGGSATAATLFLPQAVALDSAGNVYIADTRNQRVREVANGSVTTIAGNGNEDFVDGGSATAASFDTPRGLAIDASGNVAVSDTLNQRLRLVGLPAVAFGSVAMGATSSSQTIVLGNAGTAALTVSTLTLPGTVVVTGGTCGAAPITIAAGGSCSISLAYQPASGGAFSGAATFTGSALVPQTLLVSGSAVSAATLSESFTISPAQVNSPTTVAFTLTNPAANTATLNGVGFTDTLPVGLAVYSTPSLSNTCGGTATAAANGNSITLFGATRAAGSVCTVSAQVASATVGTYTNTTGAVSSTNGGSGGAASATLVVSASRTITVTSPTVTAGYSGTIVANAVYQGTTPPSGAVTIAVNGSSANVGAVSCVYKVGHSNCSATFAATGLTAGQYPITVTQAADSNYVAATGTGTLTVSSTSATNTRVTVPSNSGTSGTAIAVSAILVGANGAIPTGTVTFYVTNGGASSIISTTTVTSGQATVSYTPAASGSYTFTAVYNPAAGFSPSSDTTGQTVTVVASPSARPVVGSPRAPGKGIRLALPVD